MIYFAETQDVRKIPDANLGIRLEVLVTKWSHPMSKRSKVD